METPTEALAVEIHQFTGEGVRALVPRVTGQTEARRQAKEMPQTRPGRVAMEEDTFLNAVRTHADRDGNVLLAVREILGWSRKADLDLTFETTTRGPQPDPASRISSVAPDGEKRKGDVAVHDSRTASRTV